MNRLIDAKGECEACGQTEKQSNRGCARRTKTNKTNKQRNGSSKEMQSGSCSRYFSNRSILKKHILKKHHHTSADLLPHRGLPKLKFFRSLKIFTLRSVCVLRLGLCLAGSRRRSPSIGAGGGPWKWRAL